MAFRLPFVNLSSFSYSVRFCLVVVDIYRQSKAWKFHDGMRAKSVRDLACTLPHSHTHSYTHTLTLTHICDATWFSSTSLQNRFVCTLSYCWTFLLIIVAIILRDGSCIKLINLQIILKAAINVGYASLLIIQPPLQRNLMSVALQLKLNSSKWFITVTCTCTKTQLV